MLVTLFHDGTVNEMQLVFDRNLKPRVAQGQTIGNGQAPEYSGTLTDITSVNFKIQVCNLGPIKFDCLLQIGFDSLPQGFGDYESAENKDRLIQIGEVTPRVS